MRSRRVLTTVVSFAAGLTAAAALRRLGGRYRHTVPAPAVPTGVAPTTPAAADHDAVVLRFSRPTAPVSSPPALPARCGDTGGRTRSGAPCAARAAAGGRCHHHRLAA